MSSTSPANSLPFDSRAVFDPAGDFDAFLKSVPARWAIYLMADEQDRPVQLLCVKNLRASLKRRLGDPNLNAGEVAQAHEMPVEMPGAAIDAAAPLPGISKRVNYRELVRRIHWRRVDSAFEADWLYYEAARMVFPASYQGMLGFRSAWFVHINPETAFPRYTKTTALAGRSGLLFGPMDDKHAAARLVQVMEDAFDLCRYFSILVQAPNASACAYKGMGKCPAPCDGSISMEQYRAQIGLSVRTLIDPGNAVREHTARMAAAAGELRFEVAGKIKAYVDQLAQLGKGAFRFVRRLEEFAFLSFQMGPRAGTAKVFLITAAAVEELVGCVGDGVRPAEVMRVALERAAVLGGAAVSAEGADFGELSRAERVGIVSHHLFSAKATQGVFLRMSDVDERAIGKALRDLQKQKSAEVVEGEGVVKELQAL